MAKGASGLAGKSGGSAVKYDQQSSFFGNYRKVSNKYFELETQVLDNDNILVATSNVTAVKGSPVLIVNDNQAVYLKDWQVQGVNVKNADTGSIESGYMVKLDRNYFKPYTFKSGFDGVGFDKADTFDSLLDDAKKQSKGKNQYSTYSLDIMYNRIKKH